MRKQYSQYFSGQTKEFQKIVALLVILVIASVGTYILTGSHAATPYASITADQGTLASGAIKQTCSGTGSGSCVAFKGTGGTQTTNCFSSPRTCGYPDLAATSGSSVVGPIDSNGNSVACSSLTASGSVTASTSGQTVQNLNIAGTLNVSASNVTVKNVCVGANGGDDYDAGPIAVTIEGNNDTIENSTFGGGNNTTQATQQAIAASGSNDVATNDHLQNCSECIHTSLTLNNSYVAITDATVTGSYGEDHYEDWYVSSGTVSANHDTLLNKHGQTAVIFGDGGSAADNHITLTNSLLGGGGYMLYPYGNSSSVGSGTMNISNNRFTRAYFPNGGYYNVAAYIYCGANANQIWSNNVWDDNNAPVQC